MILASDTTYFAELWPYLWVGMVIVFVLWVIHKIRKGKWK